MAGNVFEWCRDTSLTPWSYPWSAHTLQDPVGEWGFQNVLRGCDYRMSERQLRATWRVGHLPGLPGFLLQLLETGARGTQRWWVPDFSNRTRWDFSLLTRWVWSARIGFRCVFRLSEDIQPSAASRT
jgi:hypothetical protein